MFVSSIDQAILNPEYRDLLMKFAELTLGKKETLDYFTKLSLETLEYYLQNIRVNDENTTAFYMGMAYTTYQIEARERGVNVSVLDYMKYKMRTAFNYKL